MVKSGFEFNAGMLPEGKRKGEEKTAERKRLAAILSALRIIKKALSGNSEYWALSPNNRESKPYSKSELVTRLGLNSTYKVSFSQILDFLKQKNLCEEVTGTANPYVRGKKPVYAEIEGLIKELEAPPPEEA